MNTTIKSLANDYITTVSGRRISLIEPDIATIRIEDIAHSLAMQVRFNGHVRDFYSVAQHSVIVSRIVEGNVPGLALAALLHDAAEAIVGDVVQPLKRRMGGEYDVYESRSQVAIHRAVGLPDAVSHQEERIIKLADLTALATEKRDLFDHDDGPWEILAGISPLEQRLIPITNPVQARAEFLDRFSELMALR